MIKEKVLRSQQEKLKAWEVKKTKPEKRGKKGKIKWKEGEKIKFTDADQKAQRTKCVWDILNTMKTLTFWTPVICIFRISYWESI